MYFQIPLLRILLPLPNYYKKKMLLLLRSLLLQQRSGDLPLRSPTDRIMHQIRKKSQLLLFLLRLQVPWMLLLHLPVLLSFPDSSSQLLSVHWIKQYWIIPVLSVILIIPVSVPEAERKNPQTC